MAIKSKIYTKAGDKGETTLFGGKRVKKTSQRVVAYGSIDELNASLGVAAAFEENKKVVILLQSIQNDLLDLGAEIANPKKGEFVMNENSVTKLEGLIDEYDSKLPKLTNFILPGGTKASSLLHQARTVCRRAEREVINLSEEEKINPLTIKYLNRLSDLLFVFARAANNGKDILWKK